MDEVKHCRDLLKILTEVERQNTTITRLRRERGAKELSIQGFLSHIEDLRRDLAAANGILDEVESDLDVEEINPCNYDHELVCQMNEGVINAWATLSPRKGGA